jgi:ribonuclease HI
MTEPYIRLYSDGGCITKNPSSVGGTWAYLQVDCAGPTILKEESGLLLAGYLGLPKITNNLTELEAAVRALESVPDGWDGTLFTDSFITLCRISRDKTKFNGIPYPLVNRVDAVRKRLGKFQVVLLGGHPTKAELEKGLRHDNYPVSRFNVRCDELCQIEARKHLAGTNA